MKNYQRSCITLFIVLLTLLWGCQGPLDNGNGRSGKSGLEWELSVLTSQDDLDILLARSGEGIVDWQLSREFAEMALQEFIEIGEYPSESELWDIPIAIYDDEGEVRYYEFRIVDGEEQTLGAIAGNAREDKGGPIAFVFEMEGYADELSELYNSGVLSEDDIPRLVDNDYPDAYAVASAGVTRSGRVSLDDVVDPSTGEPIDELNAPLELEEGIAAYADLLNAEQIAAARDGLENYKAEIAELWKAAKVNKGSLHNLVFRGTQKKKPRTSVDSSRIAKAEEYGRKSNGGKSNITLSKFDPVSYNWCGPSSIGFILDFIDANITTLDKWRGLSLNERISKLESLVTTQIGKDRPTLPWNMERGFTYFSNYTVSLSLFSAVPEQSIHNNMPGISLRTYPIHGSKGWLHWRNVVAYENRGWWIFTWKYMKTYDLNGHDHNKWEAWNPIYHFLAFNIVRK